MNISDLIRPEHVLADLGAADKRGLLDELARRAARAIGVPAQVIASALLAREALGSTGVGAGIAIPHARLGAPLQAFFGLFARLGHPIAFEAIDGLPVDLVFLLLTPEDAGRTHLAALATITRRLRQGEVARGLRGARNTEELYAILIDVNPDAS